MVSHSVEGAQNDGNKSFCQGVKMNTIDCEMGMKVSQLPLPFIESDEHIGAMVAE
jgi:hypothetical protein